MNYTAKSLSSELAGEWFIVIPIHTGAVLTDMLQIAIDISDEPTRSLFAVLPLLLKSVVSDHEGCDWTKEDNGKLFNYDGTNLTC